jgi:hypothetical protein
MEKVDTQQDQSGTDMPPVINAEAVIRHFQESLYNGRHWYTSLLEAIGLWTDDVEVVHGYHYRYVIEGEAFDWLLLAERLCDAVNGLVPEQEKFALLFRCQPPLDLTGDEFKNLIGVQKYHKFLNYFYGVTVEQALVQVVHEEVRKERRANGWIYHRGEEDETFIRIYGFPETEMLKLFRQEKSYPQQDSTNITELKEFAYWCFKLRLKTCEKARVASDTTKGLTWLKKNGAGFVV